MFGFQPRPFFTAQPGADRAPEVKFDFNKAPAPRPPRPPRPRRPERRRKASTSRTSSSEAKLKSRIQDRRAQSALELVLGASSAICELAAWSFARLTRMGVGVSSVSVVLSPARASAAEVIPPKPAGYFTDYAGVVSKEAALRFNEKLAQFERDTSNQVVVVVFRKMESDSSIEDYTQRVAQAWGVGQKDRRNGAVLFVFVENRNMFLQVGYGLEGVLPDVTAFDITERHIKPRFRNKDYEGGLATGIDLICKAIRGRIQGDGQDEGGGRKSIHRRRIRLAHLPRLPRPLSDLRSGAGAGERDTDIPAWAGRLSAAGRAGWLVEEAPPAAVGLVVLAGAAGALAVEAPAPAGNSLCERKAFSSQLDHERIVRAIKEAEAKTSGEIRVFVQRGELEGDALTAAQKKFHQLRMDATRERNGILIFVAAARAEICRRRGRRGAPEVRPGILATAGREHARAL